MNDKEANGYKDNLRDIVIAKSLLMASISYRSDVDALKEVEDLADEIIQLILDSKPAHSGAGKQLYRFKQS